MFIHLYKNNKIRLLFLFLTGMTEKLEELLRELIKRGREPRGKKYSHLNCDPKRKHRHIMLVGDDIPVFSYSLRQLVSLESGLWQFVCRNKLYKKQENFREDVYKTQLNTWWFSHNYQYRLLESALIPDEELARFLVDNIKVEWPGKN